METRVYTVTIEAEAKMVSRGYPATGPSYSSGGEPGAGPEFETCESCWVDGKKIEDVIDPHYQMMIDRWEKEGCNADAIKLLRLLASRESLRAAIEDAILERAINDNGWM